MNRWKNLTRGSSWRRESPEKYGIEKSSLKLPLWSIEALGIPYDYYQPFAIFSAGDWFNGVDEGFCERDAIEAVFKSLPGEALLCVFNKALQKWIVYQASANQVCSWLELCRYPVKPECANELELEYAPEYDDEKMFDKAEEIINKLNDDERSQLLRIGKERMAKKQRLIMYLNNIPKLSCVETV